MPNLRLSEIQVTSSTSVVATFTEELDIFINTSNVEISTLTPGVPNPKVLQVRISKQTLFITTEPLTPYIPYSVEFKSSDLTRFKSKNGTSFLLEDGNTNKPTVLGPEDPSDPIRDFLLTYLKDNVYIPNPGSLVRDVINSQASNLSRALYDIKRAQNDNYLSYTVTDEVKERGPGPFDRLNEEGAYEIIRVGLRPTGALVDGLLSFDDITDRIISLLTAQITSEKLVAGTGSSTFTGLTLNVAFGAVSRLKRLVISYDDGTSFTYNVEQYGYQIKNPRYDQEFASTLLTLEEQQIKLSDLVLSVPTFKVPTATSTMVVDYEYIKLGRVVDPDTVELRTTRQAVREITPPLMNQFTLQHAPIIISGDTDLVAIANGVTFLDPSASPPFSAVHPAFVKEITFKFDALPAHPGEYSVDYTTGRVFVYGATQNDGTGNFPPTATYYYRSVFSPRLDYTYDPDTYEIVANPLRTQSLLNVPCRVVYRYEDTLVPGTDFNPQAHAEVLDERIGNKLNSSISLSTANSPITNVFRVYNETSGEIYKVQRWNDHTIYFSSNNSPRIESAIRERVSFTNITNELLLVTDEFINTLGTRVLSIFLDNNRLMASSEDAIGANFNSSVSFSRSDIFSIELYYDGQTATATTNTDRLLPTQYQIDYQNGIVYVGVLSSQSYDLGTVNYKGPVIIPANPHVISISSIYQSINNILGINKRLDYVSFDDGQVLPATFSLADERFTNQDTSAPYYVNSQTITVSNDIKDVRYIFDHYDLTHNLVPVNFAEGASVAANVISLASPGVVRQEVLTVQSGLTLQATFVSPGVELDSIVSLIRVSDQVQLNGTISGYTITLDGTGSPAVGESVLATYYVKMNGSATPVVDYNRGDYFMDYTYLADEILVSYEYGDNCIDFRTSQAVNEGQPYYVTYKVGALRDSLLKNFGSLVDLSILNNNFDVSFPRENYREALQAALQSFTKGPTIPAMKSLVSHITHIEPELIEAAFQNWSLGISHLYPNPIEVTGNPQLLAGKYDNGLLIAEPEETVTFPVSSNLRLEEGTLEMWVIPEWNGLDNDATLTFELQKDGYVLDVSQIYIGSDSHHPVYDLDYKFQLNKTDEASPIGLPSAIYTQTGIFIFYDDTAKRWKVLAKDTVDGMATLYTGTITSSGEVYDVKFIPGLGEINDILRSGVNTIKFAFNIDGTDASSPDGYTDGYGEDGYFPGDGYAAGYSFDGIDFMADDEHYLFDFGKTETTNRFSLFKDGRGYLNFRVKDRGRGPRKNQYQVSADISNWKAGQKHHVAVSWKLSTPDHADEMHLFLDGVEVPNILKYGGRPLASSSDRFRTVKPELVVGTIVKTPITYNDLNTTTGSSVVYSDTINFTSLGIVAGDSISIKEIGFGNYTILTVLGTSLILDTPMPASLEQVRFSVNEFSAVVSSEIDLFSNIAVSIIHNGEETEIPGLRAEIPGYEISKNSFNQNVLTLLGYAEIGDQIAIRTLGLNHRRCRDKQFVWGNTTSILKTQLPPPINLDEARITAILMPNTVIGPSNSVILAGAFVANGLTTSQPSNTTEGRTLSVRINGNNVNFSIPVSVTITGTTAGGPPTEVLTFSSAGGQVTTNKFKTITSVDVTVYPLMTTRDSISLEIKEAYPITYSEGNLSFPVIRFSYKTQHGTQLQGTSGSTTVVDSQGYFPASTVGQKLVISSPGSVAGTYTIVSRTDNNTIDVSPVLPATFTAGIYDVFNTTIGRSGFQNGFFTLEQAGSTNTPFTLNQGWYEFDYSAHLEIPWEPLTNILAHVGSDMLGNKQAKAIVDELVILSRQLTDVRIGESLAVGQESITTDFTRLKALKPNSDTLMLLHFDSLPLVNSASFWVSATRDFMQSGESVNANFGKSLIITDNPLVVDNKGYLSTTSEGTIEFWVSPRYDTYNDPNFRFYFDASGAIVEEVTSLTSGSVKLPGRVAQVLSVRLQTDQNNLGTDYFAGGHLESDFQTLKLGTALPYQQTPVKVQYIPSGLSGDRISIYKDREGYITFNVRSQGVDYQVRQPIFWARDSWHRIRATFKFNRTDNQDEIRLFVDGEERGTILFGSGLLFGSDIIFGQGFAGVDNSILIRDINFRDPINQFYIGSDYLQVNSAQAKIDNLKISNRAAQPLVVAGQPIDVNYSSNLAITYPVIPDAFTTYLLDFDTIISLTDDLALVRDEKFGIFNFTLNIIDSFDIVSSNPKIQQILETLISALKPAQSKVTLNYLK
jgi:hypothetical protein